MTSSTTAHSTPIDSSSHFYVGPSPFIICPRAIFNYAIFRRSSILFRRGVFPNFCCSGCTKHGYPIWCLVIKSSMVYKQLPMPSIDMRMVSGIALSWSQSETNLSISRNIRFQQWLTPSTGLEETSPTFITLVQLALSTPSQLSLIIRPSENCD